MKDILKKFNKQQLAAVTHIHGPAIVIAPAGSGKTSVLAGRIGNMIKSEAQINPSEILCLTFTDAGAVAMKRRLYEYLGPEAHQVNIHTFHSFCNYIVGTNLDYFGVKNVEPVSELEKIEILYQIIDELPTNHQLSRLKGDMYFEVARINDLFQKMTEESWSLKKIEQAASEYIASLPDRENYIYKRAVKNKTIKDEETGEIRPIQKGDPKIDKIEDEKQKIDLMVAASKLYPVYRKKLKEKERYDFSDMIQWVIAAFRDNKNFLANFQEKYQYVLVDEFQDTSRSQLILLGQLMEYWQGPNLFTVGDPDQCLFEFNNARLQNINDYIEKYDPDVFYLENNYRSYPEILQHAGNVITKNKIRHTDKFLVAAAREGLGEAIINEFDSVDAEQQYIVEKIAEMHKKGVDLTEVAVLYRKHKQADDMIKVLRSMKIPVNVKRNVDVFQQPVVRQLITFLQFFNAKNEELKNRLLYEISHFRCFGLNKKKVNKKLFEANRSKRSFMELLLSGNSKIANVLADMEEFSHNEPLIRTLEYVAHKSGLLAQIRASESVYQDITYLNTFFDFVKSETLKTTSMTIYDLLSHVDRMTERGVRLSSLDMCFDEGGVTFSSCHGAKGLEWRVVFLMGLTEGEWEKSRGRSVNYRIPDNLTHAVEEDKIETARRLFYVAMTRAKDHLFMSYGKKDNKGKEQVLSLFARETESKILKKNYSGDVEYYFNLLNPAREFKAGLDEKILGELLENVIMSPSLLNKYLKCPVAAYYENILRVPFVADVNLIYGNAVHHALKGLYDDYRVNNSLMCVDSFVDLFLISMKKQSGLLKKIDFDRLVALGRKVLPQYYEKRLVGANMIALAEFRARNINIHDVPCKGDVDKMEFNGNMVNITDYKTGNPVNAKKACKPGTEDFIGGDYWRQMIFYALLVNNFQVKPWKADRLFIDIISEKGFEIIEVENRHESQLLVTEQIRDAYDGIKSGIFEPGCGECEWCRL